MVRRNKFADGKDNNMTEEEEFRARLYVLRTEHRDLDDAIDALTRDGAFNQLQIQRLKRKKLMLKDEIMRIEDNLLPDIIA